MAVSTTFAMAYGLSFAAISSLVVYTFLHNRKQIWRQYRDSTTEKPDIHMKLMRKYKEAPTWWYMSLFVLVRLLHPLTNLHTHRKPTHRRVTIKGMFSNRPGRCCFLVLSQSWASQPISHGGLSFWLWQSPSPFPCPLGSSRLLPITRLA